MGAGGTIFPEDRRSIGTMKRVGSVRDVNSMKSGSSGQERFFLFGKLCPFVLFIAGKESGNR